jgi:hypothetical protein
MARRRNRFVERWTGTLAQYVAKRLAVDQLHSTISSSMPD